MAGSTNFFNITINAGAGLIPQTGNIMRISGALTNNGILMAVFQPNSIEYNSAGQTIINPNGDVQGYFNLILSGSGIKTMPASALHIAGDFSFTGSAVCTAAGEISVAGNVIVESGTSLNLGSYNHTIAGDLTINGGTFTPSSGSVEFNGTGLQTITSSAGINLNNMIISNLTANVTLGPSTDCSIGENLTVNAGSIFDLSTNRMTALTGTVFNEGTIKTQSTSATPVPANITWDGNFEFSGTGAQTIVAGTYNNLTISGSGGVTASANIYVDSVLSLYTDNPTSFKGILDMGSNTLLMGPDATTIGNGDVTGIVKRTTIQANVTYSFGSEHTTILFPDVGTLPSEICLKISLGSAPSWKPSAIKRIYDLTQTGGSGTQALIHAHYHDSELNGNDEAKLADWVWISPATIIEYGRSSFNTLEKWVAISNVNFGFFSSVSGAKEMAMAEFANLALTWNGSVSTSWVTADNWTPAGAPSDITSLTIPDAGTTNFDPSIPIIATCGTMNIETGGVLNAVSGALLTINGADDAWNCQGGTFNPGNSTIVFKNPNASMMGSSDFNNITISDAAVLTLENNAYVGISGVLTNNGSIRTIEAGPTTFEYKGGNQTVVIPNHTTNSYGRLILSGGGIKTMPVTGLTITGDFSLLGTCSVTAGNVLTMESNVTIGSSAEFITGNFNHSIRGNFENNGNFAATNGSAITMNGSSVQLISGTSASDFENFSIANSNGITLMSDINVNNVLALDGGNLTVGIATLGINGTINKTFGQIEVYSGSSLSFGGTNPITLSNDLFTAAPIINNLTINRSGGVVLGNQNMTVNGLLDLISGTFGLGSNNFTIAGGAPAVSSGAINADYAGATLMFTNTATITLPASVFTGDINNLTVNGTGGVIASNDLAVDGVLNLQSANPSATKGSLDLWDGSSMKTLSMGPNAVTLGIGDVTGIVSRNHAFASNTPYTFGNQFTTITFASGGTYPSQIQLITTIGTSPSWKPEAIKRVCDYIRTGGSNCFFTFTNHYLDSELNGNDEAQLVRWKLTPPSTVAEVGRSDHNTADNWVANSNISIANLPTVFGSERTLANSELLVLLWNGSVDDVWTTQENWTPRSSPSNISNIVIPDSSGTPNDPTLPASTEIKTLTINEAGILNSGMSSLLTINGSTGALINDGGKFNSATGTIIFTGALATISGSTDFYNVTINSGADLRMGNFASMRIGGTVTNNGIWRVIVGQPTSVEYNGANQTVVVPNPSVHQYYNLILSGSGTKTMPESDLDILGDFSISDSAYVTLNAAVNVLGNAAIGIGNKLSISPASRMNVSGTFTNNATAPDFVLESDATGTAELVHTSDNVPATVQRYISGAAETWHFLSSPVTDQPLSGSWLPAGTYGNGIGYDLYIWDEPGSCWIYKQDSISQVNWNTLHPQGDFNVSQGYLYSFQEANPIKVFNGKLNNGHLEYDLNFSSSNNDLKGFNLMGNPYPSTIDWGAGSGWDRTDLNSSGGGYNIWIWNPAANNYGVYNSTNVEDTGTNSVSRFIAPMQGFFVQAANSGKIGMNNDIRVFNIASNWFKSTKNQHEINVRIGVKSNDGLGSDEVQLDFGNSKNETGALKLFSKELTAPSLYFSAENRNFSVLYLTSPEENQSEPIKFNAGADGNYTLYCSFNTGNFDTVVIEDRLTHHYQNMKQDKKYNFKASKSDNPDRFVLYFGTNDRPNKELPAKIYTDGIQLITDLTLVTGKTDILIYDVLGRKLLQQNVEGQTMHKFNLDTNTQMLFIHLKNKAGELCTKLLWGR
jgi:hypothetical protein